MCLSAVLGIAAREEDATWRREPKVTEIHVIRWVVGSKGERGSPVREANRPSWRTVLVGVA